MHAVVDVLLHQTFILPLRARGFCFSQVLWHLETAAFTCILYAASFPVYEGSS